MKKSFDADAWMLRWRTETDKEDEGLTWEERSRKTIALLEGNPRWERLRGAPARRIQPGKRLGLPSRGPQAVSGHAVMESEPSALKEMSGIPRSTQRSSVEILPTLTEGGQ